MKLLKYLCPKRKSSASVAKERLQIIISHEHSHNNGDYLKKLQAEILNVLKKYVNIEESNIKVQLDYVGDNTVLELNVVMPDKALADKETA